MEAGLSDLLDLIDDVPMLSGGPFGAAVERQKAKPAHDRRLARAWTF